MNFDEAVQQCAKLDGDMAEFGVYNGERTFQIARQNDGKRVWAWDTFEGMPDDNYIPELDSSDPPGKWKPDEKIIQQLQDGRYDIVPVIGKFSQTIPAFKEDIKFCFVHVDCDHYWAYKRVLEFISPRMTPGGIVKLDDYGSCAGARKATDEWLAENPHRFDADFIYF
jgi:O-methyltransferase